MEIADPYGVNAFKLKVGRDPERDLAVVAAVREAVGPEALLYVDANHGYRAEEAIRVVRAMAEYGLAWVEEPCPAPDRRGRRFVAGSIEIPVLGDESCATLADAARELTDHSCRMVSIKTGRTGFTESRRILGLCQGLGANVVCGNHTDGMVGTLAILAFAVAHAESARLPAEVSFLRCADHLLTTPLTICKGKLTAPQGDGLGVEIDEEKLARYRVDR